jgi:methylenetetrahydrofolate dehydrogenase (NADP+) / methenyltetrahydrofolate cyclohydrolase
MSELIDGRQVAARVQEQAAREAERLRADGVVPTLAQLVPTEDEGTAWYVRSIVRTAKRLGVQSRIEPVVGASAAVLVERLAALSAADDVHGVLCQTPLPAGISLAEVAEVITPAKDVDGANPTSLGRLAAGLDGAFAPATAAAVLEILQAYDLPLAGRRVVVVGRSTVVGKPVALLLLARHATVTICHSRTTDLAEVCRSADVLVVAAGRPGLITGAHVRPGAVVVDVGTNATEDGSLVGDVDPATVEPIAAALTPVPGGVGPVTTAVLLRNTVKAAADARHP